MHARASAYVRPLCAAFIRFTELRVQLIHASWVLGSYSDQTRDSCVIDCADARPVTRHTSYTSQALVAFERQGQRLLGEGVEDRRAVEVEMVVRPRLDAQRKVWQRLRGS